MIGQKRLQKQRERARLAKRRRKWSSVEEKKMCDALTSHQIFDVDDSELVVSRKKDMVSKATGQHGLTSSNVVAIATMSRSMKKMKTNTRNNNVRLIREPSAQKDLVQQTYRHLCERCFPSIFWLRTPSGMEFNKFKTDASKRYLQRETTELPTKCYQRKLCGKPGTIHDGQFQNITDHQRISALAAHQSIGLNSEMG